MEKNEGRCPACSRKNNYPSDGLCSRCYQRILGEKKIATGWILNYTERKRVYLEAVREFSELSATAYNSEVHSGNVTSQAEIKAVKHADINNQGLWILAIEDVMKTLDARKKQFVEFRREAEIISFGSGEKEGRPPWVNCTEAVYAREGERIPDRKTMFFWWSEIVNKVIRVAVLYKCL